MDCDTGPQEEAEFAEALVQDSVRKGFHNNVFLLPFLQTNSGKITYNKHMVNEGGRRLNNHFVAF